MVVAHIIDSLDTGGAEVVAVNMANALSRVEGVTAHLVVTRHAEGDLRQRIAPGVQLLVLNKKVRWILKHCFGYATILSVKMWMWFMRIPLRFYTLLSSSHFPISCWFGTTTMDYPFGPMANVTIRTNYFLRYSIMCFVYHSSW